VNKEVTTHDGTGYPRRRVTVLGFLAAMVLLPIGVVLAPFGVGIAIFAIGLALILPDA
jgi:hypothetical protein